MMNKRSLIILHFPTIRSALVLILVFWPILWVLHIHPRAHRPLDIKPVIAIAASYAQPNFSTHQKIYPLSTQKSGVISSKPFSARHQASKTTSHSLEQLYLKPSNQIIRDGQLLYRSDLGAFRNHRTDNQTAIISPKYGGLILNSVDKHASSTQPTACEGKRIFMYDLPPKFNSNILQQCDRNITNWLRFCAHIQNDGLGQEMNATTGWYGTDSYMLEVIFHARMRNYSCLTSKQEEADAFFIPYYSGLDALRFLYGKDILNRRKQGLDLIEWLEEAGGYGWRKWEGLDHFMVMGRTVWDFAVSTNERDISAWGTSLREQTFIANITVLFLESRPWKSNDQAVPYPTSFHPPSMEALNAWIEEVRTSNRVHLFTFVGAPRLTGLISSIRRAALEQCLSSPLCGILDCNQVKCSHNPEPIRDKLLSSQFCLQPPGDTATRRSAFDAMIAGCIPVFFHNDSAYTQYTWHLPPQHDQYSVFIPFKDIQKKGVRMQEVLASYSSERIQEMRHNIIGLIPNIIYLSPSAAMAMNKLGIKDAFDVSLEAILDRIARLKIH